MSDKIEDLLAKIEAATSAAEVRALVAELRRVREEGRPRLRLRRQRREDETQPEVSSEVDPDAEAIRSWPPSLRARLGRSAYSRVIDGRPVDDPGAHGQRNDLRRWSPWR